jgi:uroporphyrinogen-III synthase
VNTLAVTRPSGLGEDTGRLVKELGWNPLIVHTVELRPRAESEIFTELSRILSVGQVDWLVLMSPIGANLLSNILKSHGSILPGVLGDLHVLAIGPKTRDALEKQGIFGVFMPEKFSSTGVAEFLSSQGLEGKQVILARSSAADNTLAADIVKNGGIVETINLYDSVVPSDLTSFQRFLAGTRESKIQAILFTSSLSSSNLFLMSEKNIGIDELARRLRRIRVAAIGPSTARKLSELGVPPSVVPDTFIIDDAIKELLRGAFS